VEGSRPVLLCSGEKPDLLVVGARVRDERSCSVLGDKSNVGEDDTNAWKSLIPSTKKGPVFWLEPKETIQTLLNLPSYQDGRHVLAAATNSRLVLLSMARRVVAEVTTQLVSASLAPLGMHTVAYCSRDFCILLARLQTSIPVQSWRKFSSGLLATLPSPRVGCKVYQLMTVRPDRFVYTNSSSGVRLVEQDENADTFSLPTAMTKPALLLESMVANAI